MKKVFSLSKLSFALLGVLCLGVVPLSAAPDVALDTLKESFTDGSVSRLYTVQKGTQVREGVSFSYHPNGKLAVEAPYKNGKLDGVFKSYYENGALWQVIGYKEGIEEGVSMTYFENGAKKNKEIYRKGVLDGVVEEWDDQGKIRRKLPYMRGQLHGVAKVFDDLGALKEEMTFDKGLREGPYRRYNRGVKVLESEFQQNRCVKNCEF